VYIYFAKYFKITSKEQIKPIITAAARKGKTDWELQCPGCTGSEQRHLQMIGNKFHRRELVKQCKEKQNNIVVCR
jgi:hypothetical protein